MIYTILGAGLSGLSVADHLLKRGIEFKLYEGKAHGGGHIHSKKVGGFIWDEGPHVSFTKYEYVKKYFADNCDQEFLEFATSPSNYYKNNWIMHPAQSNMYAVPEPLRSKCVNDVLETRKKFPAGFQPANYQEWIDFAFGETFADCFLKAYTIKYWTTEPENLTTDWIGKRIYFPEIDDMVKSADGPLQKQTHYINEVRYPLNGGFYSYIKKVEERLQIRYRKKLKFISFEKRELEFDNGDKELYQNLVSTLPLPELILNSDAPAEVKDAASKLKCSQLLLINVIADHPAMLNNHWIYVYDKDFYSTRINFTELLAENNGVKAQTGIQVEVYFSAFHKLEQSINFIEQKVLLELVQMQLIKSAESIISYHSKWVDWANVIFDNDRVENQGIVFNWLAKQGLVREDDDLEPMTDWLVKPAKKVGNLILAGRFAQWKYYWTDDCVMRARYISENI